MSESRGTIGDRIKSVRGRLTQIEFAGRLGVDKNTVGRYERGERTPDGDFLLRIHSEFFTNIDWLLTGREQGGDAGVAERGSSSATRPQVGLDEELNARVVDGISRLYRDLSIGLSPMDLGRLAARMYTDVVNTFDDPEEQRIGLKAFLAQLRKQLKEVAKNDSSNETKRLA